tara:strand:- start:1451 stop:2125 length:675 start_codon:yes stop_codon:yes gene_type:complete
MDGEIGVKSAEGEGSCFWFTLPLSKGDASSDQLQRPRADLNNFKILIANQDGFARRVLLEYISSWVAPTIYASTPKECLDLLIQEADYGRPYDIAILDLGKESLPTALKISLDAKLKKTKLVLMQGYERIHSEDEIKNAGFVTSISKSFKQSQIFDCIVSLMSPQNTEGSFSESSVFQESAYAGINRGRVLVVDDNLINQMVAKTMLEMLCYTVMMAANGQEAL